MNIFVHKCLLIFQIISFLVMELLAQKVWAFLRLLIHIIKLFFRKTVSVYIALIITSLWIMSIISLDSICYINGGKWYSIAVFIWILFFTHLLITKEETSFINFLVMSYAFFFYWGLATYFLNITDVVIFCHYNRNVLKFWVNVKIFAMSFKLFGG